MWLNVFWLSCSSADAIVTHTCRNGGIEETDRKIKCVEIECQRCWYATTHKRSSCRANLINAHTQLFLHIATDAIVLSRFSSKLHAYRFFVTYIFSVFHCMHHRFFFTSSARVAFRTNEQQRKNCDTGAVNTWIQSEFLRWACNNGKYFFVGQKKCRTLYVITNIENNWNRLKCAFFLRLWRLISSQPITLALMHEHWKIAVKYIY